MPTSNPPIIVLNQRRTLGLSLLILFLLNLGNAAALYLRIAKGADFGLGIIPLFNFDQEANLPTLFNGLLLAFASILAFFIGSWSGKNSGDHHRAWTGVGCLLAFLFVDEMSGIHEVLDFLLMGRIKTEGAIAWPWVVPYAVLVVLVGGYFLRFFLALARPYQAIFGLAAALYVASAIGMEMAAASYTENHGDEGWGYGILYSIEETGEMLAIIITNFGLMRFLTERCAGFGGVVRVSD